jgi:hypothetical protein
MRSTPAFFALDHEVVMFHEPRQELYALNRLAASIWESLVNGETREGIARDLTGRLGVAQVEACGFVDELISHHRRLAEPNTIVRPRHSPYPPRGRATRLTRPASSSAYCSTRSYRLLDSRFIVRFTRPEHEREVHPMLAHLEDRQNLAPAVHEFEMEITVSRDQLVLRTGRLHVDRSSTASELVPTVAGRIQIVAVRCCPYFVDIHAGALSNGKGCLLLPGPSGSGKTTLTAALAASGMFYLSDEVAPLDDRSFRVWPVPLSLCIKSGALDALTPYFPMLRRLPVYVRSDDKPVRFLNPPSASLGYDQRQNQTVRWIVFPNYTPAVDAQLTAVPRTVALQRLLKESTSMPVRLSLARVKRLLRWIETVDCYEMSFGSLPPAAELIIGLTSSSVVPRWAEPARDFRRYNEQTTQPKPHTGLQGEGGACGHQG